LKGVVVDNRRGPRAYPLENNGGAMKRNTVKLYGLVAVGERTFLFVQGTVLALLLSAFVMVLWVPPDSDYIRSLAEIGQAAPDQNSESTQPALTPFQVWVLRVFADVLEYSPWILIALIAVGLLETLSVLRKFRELARKESHESAK
jgi:hypothetical protein